MSALIIAVVAVLAISFSCSLAETIMLSVSPPYIELLQKKKRRAGRLLAQQKKKIEETLSAILTLNTIANTAGASIVGALALSLWGSRWIALFSALFTVSILLIAEIIPKTVATHHWKKLAPLIATPLQVIIALLKPALLFTNLVTRLIPGKKRKQKTVSRAELEALVKIGQHEGTFDEEEYKMVSGVVRLDNIRVGEVMTPRTKVVAMPLSATLEEVEQRMVESGHLRIPIYDNDLDHVVGLVVGRQVWKARLEGENSLQAVLRPPRFVPESKPVDDLIRELQQEKNHLAVVVDEYGGTAGLVTLEDLLEEVFGEIHDEHEVAHREFQEVPEGLLVAGELSIRLVSERLKEEIPDDSYDTIGGFVFGLLGRLPIVGDEAVWKQHRYRVISINGRRVERLLIMPDNSDA